ncbi:hypothetical protein SAMN05421866_4178 [Chryseobacterium oranimense]|uniref:Uncharacterized protein n=1 Tax=Chryseobacterium oranimense TaxID=421058 RepID=A0A1M5WQ98_9FLAO|nr:hypothetical protein [Chryseobacterium oranimense]SHH89661.1 hypothetical protein SAMN05421866_4178 [Chryseobacterium oranimense]
MREDYKKIKKLIERNDYFYNKKIIQKKEYVINSILFAEKLDKILNQDQREVVADFLSDEYSFVKFNLSVSILKAVPN